MFGACPTHICFLLLSVRVLPAPPRSASAEKALQPCNSRSLARSLTRRATRGDTGTDTRTRDTRSE